MSFKQKCLDYLSCTGCELCKYKKCLSALDFHHFYPEYKEMDIGTHKSESYWPSVQRELLKCVVLCANCHRELHAGMISKRRLKVLRDRYHQRNLSQTAPNGF